ncbi:MAG: hypothetical protein Q4A62_05660 [Eikenella sp.]|nr:hypothetical protein [Eikenella sp.]
MPHSKPPPAAVFAWSMPGFGDVLSGAAALCCLLCALWGAWRLRLWRQLRVQNNPLLQAGC